MPDNKFILIPAPCAICGDTNYTVTLYPANFFLKDINPDTFSARRMPDKIHYRIVKCKKCGLVRSDPVIDPESLADLYAKSAQTYDAEIPNLIDSYTTYLEQAIQCLSGFNRGDLSRKNILEIGCGSGFFLEKANDYGFENVYGIEPSQQAVDKSASHIRPNIICDILRVGLLKPEQYDLICMFQVFDHIGNPAIILDECLKALKPGGGILCLNHNVSAFSARVLGERSPIFDIEHTYLYDKNTQCKIFSAHGFIVRKVGSVTNICSLRYLFRLLPLPKGLKSNLLSLLQRYSMGGIRLPVQLGNLYLVAQKP